MENLHYKTKVIDATLRSVGLYIVTPNWHGGVENGGFIG